MSYYANFVNNNDQLINVTILIYGSSGDYELTLADEPVVITQESSGLFAPIKSQSCTINILTDSALWDLYTTDPKGVFVNVGNKTTGKTLFNGYATPCQYGQDWTSLDVLSLECVDMLSSLKSIPYEIIGSIPEYVPVDTLISHLLGYIIGDVNDQMYNSFAWFWPKHNFNQANGNSLSTTSEFIHSMKMNEANFFDDDDEHTPWTCYEVLEEVCKFLNVSAVPYEGAVWFIDYFYAASNYWSSTYYDFWQYSLDMDVYDVQKTKPLTIAKNQYAAGTTAIGTDDFYNEISVNANRYDLNELTTDIYDDNNHISITKECNFGGNDQIWTQAHENFWGDVITDANYTTYKQYCRLKQESGWTHKYWNTQNPNATVNNYYNSNSTVTSSTQYINLPENKWLNTIGAWVLHYAHVDNQTTKPSKLDWKDVIMFQCLTDTCFSAQGGTIGYLYVQDIFDGRYEKPVLEYTMPYEMCFSPKDGKSWVVINNALWYQQNRYKNMTHNPWTNSQIDVNLYPTDTTNHKQTMYPIEEVTNAKSYYARQWYQTSGSTTSAQYSVPSNGGWSLCKYKLQIGDKYWNGSTWTTTESTFYIKYSGEASDASEGNYNFAYLSWMKPTNNATYQDQVGTDGYAIPIEASDKVSGQFKLTIYTPRLLPTEWAYSYIADEIISWYERGPVVFMKDLKVDYVYTDSENEWWLKHDKAENKDIKYYNETEDIYKYKKEEELKINCWQDGNPIAKSFPIINFTSNGTTKKEYIATVSDPTYYAADERPQEMNIVNRQLRHYEAPRKKVDVHRHHLMLPWQRVLFNQSTSGLSGTYVVDSQEIDVKNNVVTSHLVEYGDTNIYTKE